MANAVGPAADDLRPIDHPPVAIGYRHLGAYYVLRLTTFVMRHSYGLCMQFRSPLCVFHGPGCYFSCMVAFCGFQVGHLCFSLVKWGQPTCKGVSVCLHAVLVGVHSLRITSRGADLHFGAAVVFCVFHLWLRF